MKSLAINSVNDIMLGIDGNLAKVSDLAAVGQNCVTAMQAQLGEMVYDTNRGVPTYIYVFSQYSPSQFEVAARVTLLNVDGVLSVDEFTVQRLGDRVAYTALIATTFGSTNING